MVRGEDGGLLAMADTTTSNWSTKCPDCGHRYTYRGAPTPKPPCPECCPAAARQANTEYNPDTQPPITPEIEEFLEECAAVRDRTEDLPSRAWDFGTSVREGIESMMATIEEKRFVTDKQRTALENWSGGIERWLER